MGTLVIRSGKMYNPARYEWGHKDITVKDGRIMEGLPSGDCEVVDASDCIVTAGLTDYHVHYSNHGTEDGVNPDATLFPCGITTVVDGGSYGAANYEIYRRGVMSFGDVRILNIFLMGSGGQTTNQYPEHMGERYFNRDKIRALFRTYPDDLAGPKLRLSANIIGKNKMEKSLRTTITVAEELGCSICIRITDPATDLEKLVGMLRGNDVIYHVYQGRGREMILDENEMVRKGTMNARERGVLFDTNSGYNNYDLEVNRKAMKQGFIPDIISSDVSTAGFYLQPLHSLSRMISKYLDMGICLERVLDIITIYPARLTGRKELAPLDMGDTTDMAILKPMEKEVCYGGRKGHTFIGHQVIVSQMIIRSGKAMYCQASFA